ncbi:MAG: hypothetical protein D6797_03770 [Bdellovibrio sp.]|nr:MAG: hypothetical protein D6797_03770 [Bdellovibrio sp.]
METLLYEKQDNIGILKINRPKALNALNKQVISELESFLESPPSDIRCLVITGEGKAFVAGADIKEMVEMTPEEALEMSERGQKVFQHLENWKVPSIAAVNGYALGGGLELALACDFIIASEKAQMGLPEVSLGLIPGYGGTQRLARVVGKGVARFMTLTGNMFSAKQLAQWGLVVEVTSAEQLMEKALVYAKDLAARGPEAVGLAKRAINEGYDKNQFEALRLEAQLFSEVFKTEDHKEGLQAFLEKRKPVFKGE